MRKFKPGAVRMAMEAGVPILPVTVRGGERVWPSNRRFPRLGRVEIIYHPCLSSIRMKVKFSAARPGARPRFCSRSSDQRSMKSR